jgi:hypothetical protein
VCLSHKLLPVGHELTRIFAARNHHIIEPFLISRHDIGKRTCFAQPCGKFGAKFDLGSRTRHDRLAHLLNCFDELVLRPERYIADFLLRVGDLPLNGFRDFFSSLSQNLTFVAPLNHKQTPPLLWRTRNERIKKISWITAGLVAASVETFGFASRRPQ